MILLRFINYPFKIMNLENLNLVELNAQEVQRLKEVRLSL